MSLALLVLTLAADAGPLPRPCDSVRRVFYLSTDWCNLEPQRLPGVGPAPYPDVYCDLMWSRALERDSCTVAAGDRDVCVQLVEDMVVKVCCNARTMLDRKRTPNGTACTASGSKVLPNGHDSNTATTEECQRLWRPVLPVATIDICGLPPPKR
jgi:hypothetical protein